MRQRVIAPELKALYDNGAHVYSYSKLGTVHDCPYNAYLTYIEPRDQAQNVYSYLGSICQVCRRIFWMRQELTVLQSTVLQQK